MAVAAVVGIVNTSSGTPMPSAFVAPLNAGRSIFEEYGGIATKEAHRFNTPREVSKLMLCGSVEEAVIVCHRWQHGVETACFEDISSLKPLVPRETALTAEEEAFVPVRQNRFAVIVKALDDDDNSVHGVPNKFRATAMSIPTGNDLLDVPYWFSGWNRFWIFDFAFYDTIIDASRAAIKRNAKYKDMGILSEHAFIEGLAAPLRAAHTD